jgi:uncharacterized protein (UPF0335 family)
MPKSETDKDEYKPAHVKDAVKRIEAIVGEKESAKGSYMNRCAKLNERINAVVDQASRQGIEAKALRKVIKVRAKREAAQAELDKCEAELRVSVEALLRANNDPNDLPLFKHAMHVVTDTTGAEARLN